MAVITLLSLLIFSGGLTDRIVNIATLDESLRIERHLMTMLTVNESCWTLKCMLYYAAIRNERC